MKGTRSCQLSEFQLEFEFILVRAGSHAAHVDDAKDYNDDVNDHHHDDNDGDDEYA